MSYSYDRYIKPLASTDTNLHIVDNDDIIKYTLNPFSILNVLVNNNTIRISVKSGRVIIIPFSTINESKLALPKIKTAIDSLTSKSPLFIGNDIKNYINNIQTSSFYYQDTIPIGTGTNFIKEGTLWYDSEYGYLYIYVFDGTYYQWVTAAGDVGDTGSTGATGPAGATGSKGEIGATGSVDFLNISSSIIPGTGSIYDIGATSGYGWNDIFVNNINLGNPSISLSTDGTNLLVNGDNLIGELSTEVSNLSVVDGVTIEVNPVGNAIRLMETVASPDSGVRTFEGLINVSAEPSNDPNFTGLSLVTSDYVESAKTIIATRLNITPVVSSFLVGDGVATSFTLEHALGTTDVIIQVYNVATGQTVETDSIRVDSQNISIDFASAPDADSYKVVTMGIQAFGY